MQLQERIDLMVKLGDFLENSGADWEQARSRAGQENPWFIPTFVDLAVSRIHTQFLQKHLLEAWAKTYGIESGLPRPRTVGIVMAGNIPLVGFHDLLCTFIAGHRQRIKLSSKDQVLPQFLLERLWQWDPRTRDWFEVAPMLKGCDAYIATGSNNTARYFEYYFSRYPNLIRRNRTSVAILDGGETTEQLEGLADDVFQYFGLGCRNVTQLYLPQGYRAEALLEAFGKYRHLAQHHRYKNNYDYQLALLILNKQYYMADEQILLVEDPGLFSPISVLHYQYYDPAQPPQLPESHFSELQCVVGKGFLDFGKTQEPGLSDYADGMDTLQFLHGL